MGKKCHYLGFTVLTFNIFTVILTYMSNALDNVVLGYAKLFIVLVGAALLLIGFFGLAYDYATDLIIEASNAGWQLMLAGMLIMSVGLAFYILMPMIGEHHRIKKLDEYYRKKYPDKAEIDILTHDIREQLQVMQGRLELIDQVTESAKTGHMDLKNINAVSEELSKQKASYEKLTALLSKLREYGDKQTQKPQEINR